MLAICYSILMHWLLKSQLQNIQIPENHSEVTANSSFMHAECLQTIDKSFQEWFIHHLSSVNHTTYQALIIILVQSIDDSLTIHEFSNDDNLLSSYQWINLFPLFHQCFIIDRWLQLIIKIDHYYWLMHPIFTVSHFSWSIQYVLSIRSFSTGLSWTDCNSS